MKRSYRVDRVFPGVGRINLVSGARTRAEFAKRDALLSELYETGRLEILHAIRAHHLTINEVYSAQRSGRLDFTPASVVLGRKLWPAVEEWLLMSAPAPKSRRRYAEAWAFLKRTGVLGTEARVGDLERVDWRGLMNRQLIGPTGWNRARAAVSRFLSMILGKSGKRHPFRFAVIDPDSYPRAAEPEGRVPDLPVGVFWEIVEHVPEALRPAYITLVVTGMGPAEYCRVEATDLHPLTFSLTVHGTKLGRQGGQLIRVPEEAWPWVEQAIPAPISQDGLSRAWKAACLAAGHSGLRLYDLRHAHAQWLSDAGVSEAAIGVSLRHKTASMTRRYTKRLAKGETARSLGRIVFTSRDPSRDAGKASGGSAA